jgi:hypothetical protein
MPKPSQSNFAASSVVALVEEIECRRDCRRGEVESGGVLHLVRCSCFPVSSVEQDMDQIFGLSQQGRRRRQVRKEKVYHTGWQVAVGSLVPATESTDTTGM